MNKIEGFKTISTKSPDKQKIQETLVVDGKKYRVTIKCPKETSEDLIKSLFIQATQKQMDLLVGKKFRGKLDDQEVNITKRVAKKQYNPVDSEEKQALDPIFRKYFKLSPKDESAPQNRFNGTVLSVGIACVAAAGVAAARFAATGEKSSEQSSQKLSPSSKNLSVVDPIEEVPDQLIDTDIKKLNLKDHVSQPFGKEEDILDKYKQDRESQTKLKEEFAKHGGVDKFRRRPIKGDGNCMFRAVAFGLFLEAHGNSEKIELIKKCLDPYEDKYKNEITLYIKSLENKQSAEQLLNDSINDISFVDLFRNIACDYNENRVKMNEDHRMSLLAAIEDENDLLEQDKDIQDQAIASYFKNMRVGSSSNPEYGGDFESGAFLNIFGISLKRLHDRKKTDNEIKDLIAKRCNAKVEEVNKMSSEKFQEEKAKVDKKNIGIEVDRQSNHFELFLWNTDQHYDLILPVRRKSPTEPGYSQEVD